MKVHSLYGEEIIGKLQTINTHLAGDACGIHIVTAVPQDDVSSVTGDMLDTGLNMFCIVSPIKCPITAVLNTK